MPSMKSKFQDTFRPFYTQNAFIEISTEFTLYFIGVCLVSIYTILQLNVKVEKSNKPVLHQCQVDCTDGKSERITRQAINVTLYVVI